MKVFDDAEKGKYSTEAEARWGNTEAYSEYSEKSKNYTAEKFTSVTEGMNKIFSDFAVCLKNGLSSDSPEVQNLVEVLRCYITENFYTCTKEILSGLGQMYVMDERFRNNIDKCADGTADFISKAIKNFCR